MPKAKQKAPVPSDAHSPAIVARPSSEAVLLFLKHSALEEEWTVGDLTNALGIDTATAKQIAVELVLVGYTEPVPKKRDVWRNTSSGNTVAGVRPPRLTLETAEDLLTDIAERAKAFNLDGDRPLRVSKIVAFGGINTEHDRIQDIDLGVQLDPKLGREAKDTDLKDALKALRGRSPSLKTHSLRGWPPGMGRVIWEI